MSDFNDDYNIDLDSRDLGIFSNVDPEINLLWRFKLLSASNEHEGIFVARAKDIIDILGKVIFQGSEDHLVYEGEYITIEPDHFELITDDGYFIDKFIELNCEIGFNPLQHVCLSDEEDNFENVEYD